MIDAIIRKHLGPVVERLAELEAEIEDLQRRAENHGRIGTVSEVNPGAGTCKVSHGDLTTPDIKWFNPAAGEVSETRIPSVGEQCLLINFGGGDGGAHTAALCGLTSDLFPPVSAEPQLHRRTYPDGTHSSYDHVSHALMWINGETSVNASQELIELAIGEAKLTMTKEAILAAMGEVSILIDQEGIHFTGPVIDHEGKVLSTA